MLLRVCLVLVLCICMMQDTLAISLRQQRAGGESPRKELEDLENITRRNTAKRIGGESPRMHYERLEKMHMPPNM